VEPDLGCASAWYDPVGSNVGMPEEEPDCGRVNPSCGHPRPVRPHADLILTPTYVSACTEGIFLTTRDLRGYLDGSESKETNGVSRLRLRTLGDFTPFRLSSRVQLTSSGGRGDSLSPPSAVQPCNASRSRARESIQRRRAGGRSAPMVLSLNRDGGLPAATPPHSASDAGSRPWPAATEPYGVAAGPGAPSVSSAGCGGVAASGMSR